MGSQPDVIGRLYAHSHRALRRDVRRMVTSYDTADEVVQEGFFRTYQNVGRIDTPRAFLFATARNLAASAHRTQKSRRTEAMGDLEPLAIQSTDKCPEERALADEELRLLQQAVARLPPQCGAVKFRRGLCARSSTRYRRIRLATIDVCTLRRLRSLPSRWMICMLLIPYERRQRGSGSRGSWLRSGESPSSEYGGSLQA